MRAYGAPAALDVAMHARLLLVLMLPLFAIAAETVQAVDSLLKSMRAGGYVLFVRHPEASVGNDSDGVPEWWKDCSKQRLLSEAGKAQARRIGAGLARLGTPLAVKSSEYCRAVESILFMGLREFTITPALNHMNAWPREASMDDGIREAMRGMLAALPAPGKNTVLVGHVQNYPRPPDNVLTTMNMGDTAVFKPDGVGGFRFVLLLRPEDW
jgi:phosphohistidine phosphatase SixA